jgi:predicted Rossmann fold flavoprotein
LFTHHGLSGPAVLDLSRFIEKGDVLQVALCRNAESISSLLTGKKNVKNALSSLEIPEQVLIQLLEYLDIPYKSASEVSRAERKELERSLSGFPFVAERIGGWNEAMATAGGVSLQEVDRQTMQSRLVPNLFFCGEVLDIDGDTGGYNIQFALSSGTLAGNAR